MRPLPKQRQPGLESRMYAANGREMTWPFLRLVHPQWAALGGGRKATGAYPAFQPVQLPPTRLESGRGSQTVQEYAP